MIELNNLLTTSSTSSGNTKESTTAGLLPDIQADQDNSKDDAMDPNLLDPNAFVLLLAQVLSNVPIQNEVNTASGAVTEDIDPAVVATNPTVKQLLTNLQTTPESSDAANAANIDENVAVAWIDSKSFKELTSAETNPQSVVETQAKTIPLTDAEVALELESDTVINDKLISKDVSSKEIISTASNSNDANSKEIISNEMNSKDVVAALAGQKGAAKNAVNVETNPVQPASSDVAKNTPVEQLKEDLLQSLNTLSAATATTKEHPHAEQKIDGILTQNAQANTQQNTAVNQAHQTSGIPIAKSLDIPVDINNSQWANKFSEHIVWMGHQGINSASIKIHPEELGPLEINIKVVKDITTVNINSHSSHVRDIVDQSLPRLREMMADQGLNLAEVHVGSSDANSRQFSQNNDNNGEQEFLSNPDDEAVITPLNKKPPKGLIDYFA